MKAFLWETSPTLPLCQQLSRVLLGGRGGGWQLATGSHLTWPDQVSKLAIAVGVYLEYPWISLDLGAWNHLQHSWTPVFLGCYRYRYVFLMSKTQSFSISFYALFSIECLDVADVSTVGLPILRGMALKLKRWWRCQFPTSECREGVFNICHQNTSTFGEFKGHFVSP